MKTWISFILLSLLTLTACASPGDASPTPTIVRLDRSGGAPTAEVQTAEEAPAVTGPTPSVTAPAAVAITATPTPQAEPPAAGNPTAPPQAVPVQAEIMTHRLNVRTGPGANFPIMGELAKGDKPHVIGINANGSWLQIVLANDMTGWVSAKPAYIRLISAQRDDLPVIEAGESAVEGAAAAVTSASSVSIGQPASRSPNAAISNKLIFVTRSGGDLYVINDDGTGLQKLTGGIIDPVVSPDGQQIAFTRWDSGELGTLFTMNIDGSNERAVLGETLQAKSPTWSPDGQEIIVSFQHGGLRNPSEECRRYKFGESVRVPGNSTVTGVTTIGEKDIVQICFIPFEDLQWSLRQVSLGSGQFEDLPVDLYSFSPTWDPNQAWRVLYNTDKGLMQLDINTDKLQPVTEDFRDKAPVFSPDGQKLALSYRQHDHWEVYTYDLASGARQRLTKPPILADPQYNSAAPAWSPDGSQIAFVTDRHGPWQIWVMNADGTEQRPLFPPEMQTQWGLDYQGVNERLLNWVGSSFSPLAGRIGSSTRETALATNISLEGTWDFTFGSMVLSQQGSRVEGSYQWYGGVDTGQIEGIIVADLNQFQGIWISNRNPTSQKLLRWQLAPDGQSFSGQTVSGSTGQQWCGLHSGQPLPTGCGFSGSWNVRFGSPPGTGQATLTQSGPTVHGTYNDNAGQSGEIKGTVSVQSTTEMKLTGTWRDAQGQSGSFEWRLDLTTGRTFQGRRNPGNSEWCGWRTGIAEPRPCGWED